jgi:hypothetical protein
VSLHRELLNNFLEPSHDVAIIFHERNRGD